MKHIVSSCIIFSSIYSRKLTKIDFGYCDMAKLLPFPGFKGCIKVMSFSELGRLLYLHLPAWSLYQHNWWLFIRNLIAFIFYDSMSSHPYNNVAISILRHLVEKHCHWFCRPVPAIMQYFWFQNINIYRILCIAIQTSIVISL